MDVKEGFLNITIKNILNLKMPHSQNIYKYKIINNKQITIWKESSLEMQMYINIFTSYNMSIKNKGKHYRNHHFEP